MTTHTVGTREEWLAARKELLEAEKEHLRHGDELARRSTSTVPYRCSRSVPPATRRAGLAAASSHAQE
jgi:hypothetical protein